MKKALYCGTFDPVTNGHLDIMGRSFHLCEQLIIAVGNNSDKNILFSLKERVELVQEIVSKELVHMPNKDLTNIKVVSFDGLLVDFAKSVGANIIIRGIRSVSDFEYEINLANINKVLAPDIDTVFLPTKPDMAVISSSAVKEIAKFHGDISKFVPPYIAKAVHQKFGIVTIDSSDIIITTSNIVSV